MSQVKCYRTIIFSVLIFLCFILVSASLTTTAIAQVDERIEKGFLSPSQQRDLDFFKQSLRNGVQVPTITPEDAIKEGAKLFGLHLILETNFGKILNYKSIVEQYTGLTVNDEERKLTFSNWYTYSLALAIDVDWSIVKALGLEIEGSKIYQANNIALPVDLFSYRANSTSVILNVYFLNDLSQRKIKFSPYISFGGGFMTGNLIRNNIDIDNFNSIYFLTGLGFIVDSGNVSLNLSANFSVPYGLSFKKNLYSQTFSNKKFLIDLTTLSANIGIIFKL